MKDSFWDLVLAGLALLLLFGDGIPQLPISPTKPDAAIYVYEKDDGSVPPAVAAALDKLKRQGMAAEPFEEDTPDEGGAVPEQYIIALEAARKEGLPCLVIAAGEHVVRTVKDPRTEEAVLEAAK